MKIVYALIFVALLVLGGIVYVLQKDSTSDYQAEPETDTTDVVVDESVTEEEPEPEPEPAERGPESVIGQSANGNDITAYHFGSGDEEILFVGGTHGGYSFNTALVAFELVDYLTANPDVVPEGYTATVIPVLNPDGLNETIGTTGRFDGAAVTANDEARVDGRFNGNGVDINRNFDCQWEAEATWQNRDVSGGSAPFSEPEALAIRQYVDDNDIAGAVVWYSQAGGVYASQCDGPTLPATTELTDVFADAAGYPAFAEFDFYEITGDMVNWFAKERIPAISVLLTDHENAEWSKNRAGVNAVLEYFAE